MLIEPRLSGCASKTLCSRMPTALRLVRSAHLRFASASRGSRRRTFRYQTSPNTRPGISTPADRTDCAASSQPQEATHAGRAQTAALSSALEGRAHLCLVGQLPAAAGALGASLENVPGVLPSRLPAYHLKPVVKPLLGIRAAPGRGLRKGERHARTFTPWPETLNRRDFQPCRPK